MKTVMIIIDGLGDEPVAELGGRTPLEAAFIPNIHYVASRGRIGRIRTTFPGFPIESMVCIMGLLGYDPEKYYPCGRAAFEAMAKGIPLGESDLILRCNTITMDPQKEVIADFTANMISDSHARQIISRIRLPKANWELYPGQSYRNILILRGEGLDARSIRCFEPHMNIGKPVAEALPATDDPRAEETIAQLRSFLLDTRRQIESMGLGAGCTANMLWVWSPSRKPVWPSFEQRTGLRAAVVGGLDFLHGIAMAAGIHFDVIPGATGYINTNYQAKAEYTLRYLREFDFVLTHVNAPDEEAHQHNHRGKISAIESADRLIVGPVLQELHRSCLDGFRIIICGDHGTRCSDGRHTDAPTPLAVFGGGIAASNAPQFREALCDRMPPVPSLELLRECVFS